MRFFSTRQAAERLGALAVLERACAHVLAGRIVKTPDLETKLAWGRQLAASMEFAARLADRTGALLAGETFELRAPARWIDTACAADVSRTDVQVLRGVYRLKLTLAAQYADYVTHADPIADAASLTLVRAAFAETQAQIKWYRRRVGGVQPRPLAWSARQSLLSAGQAVWPPLDRAPRVARPAEFKRGEPGALRLLPVHPGSKRDTGLFLHNFLNEEFTTLELVARNSYEHPEMPWAFHRDAARHAGDEARHAQLFLRALPSYGLRYGDYPVYTYSYEGEYEFLEPDASGKPPCAPGSKRELLWRLILRQVVHEGLALDSTAFEVKKREHLRQRELARVFGYTLADEVFHAGAGLKWSRYLVDGDEAALERERTAAYDYYRDRLKERRLAWGASHIEQAAAEAEQLEALARHNRFPFARRVNKAARRRAGFSEEQIRRIEDEG